MLPFVDQQLQETQALMGRDFWPYGVSPNRRCLEYFLQQHHKQGLSDRLVDHFRAVPSRDLRGRAHLTVFRLERKHGSNRLQSLDIP